jgi:hypothetical protein
LGKLIILFALSFDGLEDNDPVFLNVNFFKIIQLLSNFRCWIMIIFFQAENSSHACISTYLPLTIFGGSYGTGTSIGTGTGSS